MAECQYSPETIEGLVAPLEVKSDLLREEAMVNLLRSKQLETFLLRGYGTIDLECGEIELLHSNTGRNFIEVQAQQSASSYLSDFPKTEIEKTLAKMQGLLYDELDPASDSNSHYLYLTTDIESHLAVFHEHLEKRIVQYESEIEYLNKQLAAGRQQKYALSYFPSLILLLAVASVAGNYLKKRFFNK